MTDAQHTCGDTGFTAFAPGWVEQSLPARFRHVVAAHRDCLAVVDGADRVTYGELDDLSGRIAAALVARLGAGWEPVALALPQGLASITATLAVLRAGKAYVPLEASAPPGRLAEIVAFVGARVVVVDGEAVPALAGLDASGPDLLVLDELTTSAGAPPAIDLAPEAIAAVYLTSGSTGSPKGVIDTHRTVVHNVLRHTDALRIAPADRLSLVQPPAFSGAASSTFGALLNGAALFPFRLRGDNLRDLAAMLRTERLSVYHSVPSIFRSMVGVDGGAFPDVRVVRLEGDRASWGDVELHRRHFAPGSVLANGLGTTETGLCRQLRLTTTTALEEGALPVGYPVADVTVAVVGEDGRPLPTGTAGEIVVRGRHLSPGYWRRPDLTDAAFRVDEDDPSCRAYRTGDLGRLRPDGCLEYLGRRDGGLKVLGQATEPAEVEAELLRIDGVREAAVTAYPGRRGEGRLAAHLVVAPGAGATDPEAVRAALAARLPAHMVPSLIRIVDALPLSDSGKIDRLALAAPSRGGAPRDDDEVRLVRLWEQVLERGGIGVDDDFFEVGGDSLAAAELLAALESQVGGELPPSLLVWAPTIALLAEALRGGEREAGVPAVIAIQPRGSGPPLVLVEPEDGTTNVYAGLVRALGDARPVWRLDPPRGEMTSVAALAAGHVRTLTEARPEGPYLVGGFCFGAVVALEMARQLRAEGRDVRHVALIGVGPYDFPTLVSASATAGFGRLVPRLGRRVRQVRTYPVRRRLRHCRRWMAVKAGGPRPVLFAARRAAAMARYAPRPLPGHATLYLSAGETAAYSDDPAGDWAGLCDDARVDTFPGPHRELLREPVLGELARRIARDIDASLGRG